MSRLIRCALPLNRHRRRQFRQALQAVRILAVECLALTWAAKFLWDSFADQARDLLPSHRTLLRESHPVTASNSGFDSGASTLQFCPPGTLDHILSQGEAETLGRFGTDLRRFIRIEHLAVAREQTYCHASSRFTRFCLRRIGQPRAEVGRPSFTANIQFLALARHVSSSTHKQAHNALVFLLCHVLGRTEFMLEFDRRPRQPSLADLTHPPEGNTHDQQRREDCKPFSIRVW